MCKMSKLPLNPKNSNRFRKIGVELSLSPSPLIHSLSFSATFTRHIFHHGGNYKQVISINRERGVHESIFEAIQKMECPAKTLTFKVNRRKPEVISPAEPTPHEFKPLSDIDDQRGLRLLPRLLMVYKGSPGTKGKDPVSIIRNAIAKALVFYYPLAGRLREIPATGKLVVECTAEGPLFIEADADATLQDLVGSLHPPFPNSDQLLYNVPGSDGITDCPLLLFQVTRLSCGGFIFGVRFNHSMVDGVGIIQLFSAISELARGGKAPSIRPIWERELLTSRNPPCISFPHPEYETVPCSDGDLGNVVERSFFFSTSDIANLRRSLPRCYRNCSQFDLLAACVWRCRTIAIATDPNKELRLFCVLDVRSVLNPKLPTGYYGNAIVFSPAVATVEELSKKPLEHTVELIRKAKSKVSNEYVRSVMDLLVARDRPSLVVDQTFVVSDLRRFPVVDFGWGKPIYYGTADGGADSIRGMVSWFLGMNNESGALVPISLPLRSMEVFRKELEVVMDDARRSIISNASTL